ncbi:nucleoside diphosphate kinase regulator [Altererythrobacter sp. Root672]|uniref:nucleoside diphosphate kinase regulator n=1 Tax=Altererythrobacter sp. Root672 TaxID=1736584 RepID=UPI0006F826E0|nr:nucleoside diphosphate kinase regulator [Altererythrobacter sp. Root672]KRA84696.1 transcription elongation factor GreAB [Altererythrobacter sp. Root672]
MTVKKAATRPPIVLIEEEADALADLAISIQDRHPNVGRLLLEEIERAETLSAAEIPNDVVTMGSTVAFVDEKTGDRRTVTLVFPKDADIAEGRLSILTPVGAGLIGLRTGQSISWPDRSGEERLLTIESVTRSN